MRLYSLEKWYFDALTPDGKFVLCYLAVVRIAGLRFAELNLNVADTSDETGQQLSANSRQPGIRNPEKTHIALSVSVKASPHRYGEPVLRIRTSGLEIEADDRAACIRVMLGSADIELDFASPTAEGRSPGTWDEVRISDPRSPTPDTHLPPLAIAAGKRQIVWQPLIVAARVKGRIRVGDTGIDVPESNGYVDYVASDILPPRVPVSELYWGRIHAPQLNLTYTLASGSRQNWTRLIGDAGEESFEFDDVRIEPEQSERSESLGISHPRGYALVGASGSNRIEMRVRHVRNAVESEFLKTGRGPFGALLRRLTKNPRGVKFLARADVMLERNGNRRTVSDVPCIDEYVRFG